VDRRRAEHRPARRPQALGLRVEAAARGLRYRHDADLWT
jgi:hypothetical protein